MKVSDRMAKSYQGKPQSKMLIIRDTILKGFALKVSKKGSVSFCTEARIKGKGGSAVRRTVGTFPAFSTEQAREIATENLRIMYLGEDPAKVRKAMIDTAAESDSWTLEKVFTEYLHRRNLKDSTRKDYTYRINQVYSDWLSIPITEISRKMVEDRFYEQKHKSVAILSSTILSTLLDYTKRIELSNGERLITENPCDVLRDKRVDRKLPRRQTVISPKELFDILGTVEINLSHEERLSRNVSILRAIYVIALTGCRKNEILKLKRKDVHIVKDGKSRQGRNLDHFIIRDTKNSSDHIVPITTEIQWVIQEAMDSNKNSPWLFPSNKDVSKPVHNPRTAVKRYLLGYSLHDCRRTFITVANELGIDVGSIKKLVGHKNNDVTEEYIIHRTEQRLPILHKLFTQVQREMLNWKHLPTAEELFVVN